MKFTIICHLAAFLSGTMYVCMYVCMYDCMYVCNYVCMYVCMNVCVYVYICVCMCVCMYIHCMYECMYVCMYVLYMYKFSRHVFFEDVTNPAFLQFYFRGLPTLRKFTDFMLMPTQQHT